MMIKNAIDLAEIVACAGLAQNLAALRALSDEGIQKGHMKMHLTNLLNKHNASEKEKAEDGRKIVIYASDKDDDNHNNSRRNILEKSKTSMRTHCTPLIHLQEL